MNDRSKENNAWSPGLESSIPARLLPSVSAFRSENSDVSFAEAKEAAEFCGLKPIDMVAFNLERLITHELLIRVTADLSVPDGPNYEELGINLRGIVAAISQDFVHPKLPSLYIEFETLSAKAEARARTLLLEGLFERPEPIRPKQGILERFLGKAPPPTPSEPTEKLALKDWETQLHQSDDPFEISVLSSLIRLVGGHVSARGTLLADVVLLTRLCTNMVMNTHGSAEVGRMISPVVTKAAEENGYRFLPIQPEPVIMNVKGASAAGKSTVRPAQRQLAEKLKIPWEDFALISPDYWRKYLVDYESLGPDFKYGAMLTGQELEIIDRKLDAYIQAKAKVKGIPHLLIDRFRFDSFSMDADGNISSSLLTRFGDTVFLFFMITPPHETVERAWKRGLETGRYKAVDDLLYHNIEAYTGMPQLFFSWLSSSNQNIHFEFLDNDVTLGQPPRTIAFGDNSSMTVLNPDGLHNIDRFRAVNIDATKPEDVLMDAPDLTFLDRCVAELPALRIIDPASGQTLREAQNGNWLEKPSSDLSEAEMKEARTLTLGDWSMPAI